MAGRPANAKASDPQSILDKANWEMEKFNAKVANNMGKILEEYYSMAFDPKMKENTRLSVLKELIKMQKENLAAVEEVEPHEKSFKDPEDGSDVEESDYELDNILSVEFNEEGKE
jgi:hypothetical protein